jgi:hypothetical protein
VVSDDDDRLSSAPRVTDGARRASSPLGILGAVPLATILRSERDAHRFAQRGVPAAEELLEAIRKKKHEALGYLENVLIDIRAPELVDLYAPLVEVDDLESSDDVFLGLRLLGATRDPRAVPHLVRYLGDPSRRWRDRAATALARMALPEGRDPLLAYAGELLPEQDAGGIGALADRCATDYEMRPLRALIDIAKGFARLGDHRFAFVPFALIDHVYPKRTDRFEQTMVRADAAHAIRHVVGEGLLGAIASCIRGREIEAARHGAFAAFLVGTAEMVPLLVEASKKRDHELRSNAPIWLHRLFAPDGAYEEMKPAARAKWLAAREIPSGVVYRAGKPREESELIALLGTENARDALRELSVTLGDLDESRLLDPREQSDLGERARARLGRFPARSGTLRRHGLECAIPRT